MNDSETNSIFCLEYESIKDSDYLCYPDTDVHIRVTYNPITKEVTREVECDGCEQDTVLSDVGLRRFFRTENIEQFMTMEDPEEIYVIEDGGSYKLTISTPDGRERTMTTAEVTSAYPHLTTFERYAQKIRREAWKQLEASGKLPFA